jgi:phytanoyl-CoA hydroxylase
MTALSAYQLEDYRRFGYVHLRGALPADLLQLGRQIIEPWVDLIIDEWRNSGLIDSDYRDQDFWHRLLVAWRAAGQPLFRRRPNKFLVNSEMWLFFHHPTLLAIAEQVLGTHDLNVHGIYNARPQLPGAPWSDTPWHQDSQYWGLDYGGIEPDTERRTHVVTFWIPLQSVDAITGSLHMMSKEDTGDQLFDIWDYDYKNTGFLGLTPESIAHFAHYPVAMNPGDLLIFDQRTPHCSKPNQAERIRWSIDVRYEATKTATLIGRKYGFVVQSADKAKETSFESWKSKVEVH